MRGTTFVVVAMIVVALWESDEYTGEVIFQLVGLYVVVMLIVGIPDFVITSLVRSKRAADRAQRANPDV
jgi:hypothetical protein